MWKFVLAVTAFSHVSGEVPPLRLAVFTSDFTLVREVEDPVEAARIVSFFRGHSCDEFLGTKPAWTHKLDIANHASLDGRWLYDATNGHLAKLNYALNPCYEIRHVEQFNRILLTPSSVREG